MTQVEFYTGVADPVAFACCLLRKAARQGVRVQVTAPPAVLSQLDRSLWTLEAQDFVPHVRMPGAPAAVAGRTPIWLTAAVLQDKEDICYATTNRQAAVKEIAGRIDALLVIGAPNSSNTKRLVEVGRAAGCPYAQLVQRAAEIDWRALQGARAMGLTAGASAPEELVTEVIDALKARFNVTVELVETAQENVEFKVPRVLREPA